jgi:uncharacterized protein (TIGR00369 family)
MATLLEFFTDMVGKTSEEAALKSSLGRWLNGRLIKISEEEAIIEYTVREDMTNPLNFLHGGTHAAILDDIIGLLITVQNKEHLYLTANLTVDYLGRASIGEIITAKSRIVKFGKTIINAEAEIRNERGQLISRATSNLANTGIQFEMFAKERDEAKRKSVN